MKLSEVGMLITYIAAFDGRIITEDDNTAAVWCELSWVRQADFEQAKLAVRMFFSQLPDDRGRVPYFDTRQLRFWLSKARQALEIEQARQRAQVKPIKPARGTYAPPAGWRDQVQASLKQVPDAQ